MQSLFLIFQTTLELFLFVYIVSFCCPSLYRKSVRRINVPAGTRKLKIFSNGCCEPAAHLQVDVTRLSLERGIFSYSLRKILKYQPRDYHQLFSLRTTSKIVLPSRESIQLIS